MILTSSLCELLYIPIYNLLGGRGIVPGGRILFRVLIITFLIAQFFNFNLYVLIAALLGLSIWTIPGHGKYFSAFHGRFNPNEKEIAWIDRIGAKKYPYDGKKETNLKRGVIQMSLRGLYLYPFFLLMALLTPFALVLGLFMLLQGPIYGLGRYVSESLAVPLGEVLTGFLIVILTILLKILTIY